MKKIGIIDEEGVDKIVTTNGALGGVINKVCLNLQRTCNSLDKGKCKMINAKCVFQQTCL